jgi:hypothetical protein
MYKLMPAMRVRIISAPAFTGDKMIAAKRFEHTMAGEAHGNSMPTFLWKDLGGVPLRHAVSHAFVRLPIGACGQTGRLRHHDALVD